MKPIMKFLPIFFLLAVLAVILISKVQAVPPKANLAPSDYSTGLGYYQAFKMKKPMVVNFYVDWCHYCQGFAPKLEALRREYGSNIHLLWLKLMSRQIKKLWKILI